MATKFSWTKHLDFMVLDSVVLLVAFCTSYYLKFGTPLFWLVSGWTTYLVFVLTLNLAVTFVTRPYSGILRRPYYMEIIKSLQLTAANALVASFVFYLLKVGALYSRGTSLYMYAIFFALSALCNTAWKKLLASGRIVVRTTARVPLFIIGDAAHIDRTIHDVTAADFAPYDVVGIHLVDAQKHPASLPHTDAPLIASDYCQYILDQNIREVLVAVPPTHVEKGVLQRLHANAIDLDIVVESAVGFLPEDQRFNNVGIYRALGIGAFSFRPGQLVYLAIKRLADIACGLVGLVVLVPTTILVKLAYLLGGDTSRIFYRQTRVGKDGKTIRIWKFRSMVPNADEVLQELLKDERYRAEWDTNQKFEDDPRITKVGNVLRKTSVDELPQLLNVLVGDMSLVGPRPLVVGELEKFGGLKLYQRVKPGITGWWACNGRSNIDYKERLELEYYYVKNCSLYLDLTCVFRTVLAVLRKDGAK